MSLNVSPLLASENKILNASKTELDSLHVHTHVHTQKIVGRERSDLLNSLILTALKNFETLEFSQILELAKQSPIIFEPSMVKDALTLLTVQELVTDHWEKGKQTFVLTAKRIA
jgi:hypothetical protein